MRMIPLRLAGLALAAVTTISMSTACDDSQADGENVPPEETGCANDRECGSGSVCDKENDGDDLPAASDPEGVCLRVTCSDDSQCNEGEVCLPRINICAPPSCDPGDPNACSDGDLCQYVDGQPRCEPAPAATGCNVVPAVAYVAAGGTIEFEGTGTLANNKLAPHTTFGWNASGGSFDGALFTAPAAAGDVTITGTTVNGSASCTATVKVYAPVAAADLRVVVIDQGTRLPLANVPVAARVAGENVEGETAADGSFTFTGGADATSVSAFPAGHQWHTLVDPPNDVVLYTGAVQETPVVDGVTGTFDFTDVKSRGDIRLGLAGAAINAAITDLNFTTIIGEFVDTTITIDSLTPPEGLTVGLPEGLVIGLGAEDFKANYVALSDKKGPSVAWALAGRVELSKVGPIIEQVSGADNIDFGGILGAVLPFFATFNHAVVTGLEFDPAPRNGTTGFEDVTIAPNTLMTQLTGYDMPTLPCAPGGFNAGGCTNAIFQLTTGTGDAEVSEIVSTCPAELGADQTCEAIAPFTSGAVILTGVVVPGQGLVPLGISAGLDVVDEGDTADGIAEQAGDNAPAPGTILVDAAPAHDGIEGNLYVTVAIAIDINQISGAQDLGASVITQVSKQLPSEGNDFNGNGFLQSQGGTFVAGGAGSFALTKKGDADFYRINLSDNGAQEWNVWFAGNSDGEISFADLAQHGDVSIAERAAHADVQAFNLGAGYEGAQPADFDELFAFNGQDLDNLLYYLGGWSSEACKAGGICELGVAIP